MSRLQLSFAGSSCDRFAALRDGSVQPEGIDLNVIDLPVEEIFYRQLTNHEFDLSEMSLSSYVLSLEQSDPGLVAIPVFPSRYFRHQTMFVNADSGIRRPEDLAGRRVGVPEYQITAGVWQRGMLQDEYGVDHRSLRYVTGGVEHAGRTEKISLDLPPDVDLTAAPQGRTLSDLLVAGEIDALLTAHVPEVFYSSEKVVRLFGDYKAVEQDYFRRTRVFPIMHVVALRRDVYERQPWIARSLMKAFEASLRRAHDALMYRSSLAVMLPWLADHVEETQAVMGERYWSYGLEPNRAVLETFLRYSRQQGLARRDWRPEQLFAPNAESATLI
ncbi:hypothetical protein KZX45_09495 [Georgenia sp. EYE_87]|uniref:hypothetical protein n=1 Tax=Georgenia sp. EYE_87 TaxID=2853448 RepID=UPI002005BE5D|nr:hypothetical protein [Georgenia sp. EYE_87]MCK6210774.1 hypothetical protein [Georgenia sp. EYE_87]